MSPASLTEFSVLKHFQTFRIWDWAPRDIFPKSRLVMVAESSGRRSMRSSALLSQPFRPCDRMKWKRGSISAQLIYYFMTKGRSESCGQSDCSIDLCTELTSEQRSEWSWKKTKTIWMGKLVDQIYYLPVMVHSYWSNVAFCSWNSFTWQLLNYIWSLSLATTPTLCYDTYLVCTPWNLLTCQIHFNSNQHIYLLTYLHDLCCAGTSRI